MGKPGLKSNDTRGWQKNPPPQGSRLEHLDAILDYLAQRKIDMYRMSSRSRALRDASPTCAIPRQWVGKVIPRAPAQSGPRAKRASHPPSFHPSQFVLLNSPDPELTRKSIWDLASRRRCSTGLEPSARRGSRHPHVGGVYGDLETSRARWAETWRRCRARSPPPRPRARRHSSSARPDVLWINARTGVPLVFDYQHFWCLNPSGST
jgi:UV DNA damage endonuclease